MYRFKLPKYTYYYADETRQYTYRDYYTTVKAKEGEKISKTWKKALRNLKFQISKEIGMWWQYIDIDPNDVIIENV